MADVEAARALPHDQEIESQEALLHERILRGFDEACSSAEFNASAAFHRIRELLLLKFHPLTPVNSCQHSTTF